MSYYPKSQIKTNLYTNGNELFTTDGTSYTGYYYQLSNGKKYSGRTPQSLPNFELFLPSETILLSASQTLDNSFPSLLTSTLPNSPYPNFIPSSKILPTYSPQLPTPQDYQTGEFRRYFCKKTNEIKYIEIDKKTYDLLVSKSSTIEYSLYLPFYLDWQLTGNIEQVARTNKNNAELTAQKLKLPGLLEYLRLDFTKYYK